mmetsp:Transcript_56957/g.78312  ORF Transcript_56957/g.78312 Transcript_56957/m.78312 type:complete len:102 (+) Transcript_56957:1305-1610(+)|eukprot:CAMPEP_0176348012 /NCGR_PEP_ID=MMETSP0126-20121128/7535_1 /TAXON_ID=141414 ORGANISM="Strombidinopsis acuminatum, Strain SPMC142" /NCGR_SAMPLE_ID=MMETSP0126 /ASSEMBLY_ACC=CAM_ASM_000229 /LENGTH=101 /DNA_ID=CAMNT_0017696569 /DNA_START=1383 /DNA_END=1688 /DNA_ORIENTATION=+
MPKPFKKTFVDKIPNWVQRMEEEGKSQEEIKDHLAMKSSKYIDKYGNKSQVGMIIDMYNHVDPKKVDAMQVKPSYNATTVNKDLLREFDQRKLRTKQQRLS